MNNKIRNLCTTAMGIALFVVMAFAIRVPVFENYYLCLGYVAMIVFLYKFGIVSGTIVGTLGVILYCLLTSGLRGMPGWTIGNIVIGILLGISFKITRNMKGIAFYIINSAAIAFSTFLGILITKSFVECILYAQPMVIRIGKNVYAFIADVIVLIFGLFFCKILGKAITSEKSSVS